MTDPTAPQPLDAENFHGHDERECGEHRTTGPHRAWCFNCSEWCSLVCPCKGCELPALRAEVDRLTANLATATSERDAADACVRRYREGWRSCIVPDLLAVWTSWDARDSTEKPDVPITQAEADALARAAQPQEAPDG